MEWLILMFRIESGGKHEGVVGVWMGLRNMIVSINLAVLRRLVCRGVLVSKQPNPFPVPFVLSPFLDFLSCWVDSSVGRFWVWDTLISHPGEFQPISSSGGFSPPFFFNFWYRRSAFERSKAVLLYRLVA